MSSAEQCYLPTFISNFCILTYEYSTFVIYNAFFITFDTSVIALFLWYLKVSIAKFRKLTTPDKSVSYDETYCKFTYKLIIIVQLMLVSGIVLLCFEIAIAS